MSDFCRTRSNQLNSANNNRNRLSEGSLVEIVSAYAARNDVNIDQIADLVLKLASIQFRNAPSLGNTIDKYPSVSGTRSLKRDDLLASETDEKVNCLACGKSFSMLKRHIRAEHGLSESEYREAYGLSADHPLVAPNYSARRALHAKNINLGRHKRKTANN